METAKKGVLSFVSGAGTALARNASQLLEGPLAAIGYVSDNLSGKGTSWQESVNAVREWGNTYVKEGAEEAENKSAYYLGNCAGDILAFVSVIAGAKGASSNSQGFSTGGSVTMVTPEGVVIVVDGEAVLEGVLVAPVGGYYTGETKAESIEEDWGNFWNSINGGFGSGGKGGAETGNKRGVGGKGWRGDKIWKQNINKVGEGGTIQDLNGQVPTQQEAIDLINEAGGTVNRIEGPHNAPNPHNFNYINYTTPSGGRGTIKIQ